MAIFFLIKAMLKFLQDIENSGNIEANAEIQINAKNLENKNSAKN